MSGNLQLSTAHASTSTGGVTIQTGMATRGKSGNVLIATSDSENGQAGNIGNLLFLSLYNYFEASF